VDEPLSFFGRSQASGERGRTLVTPSRAARGVADHAHARAGAPCCAILPLLSRSFAGRMHAWPRARSRSLTESQALQPIRSAASLLDVARALRALLHPVASEWRAEWHEGVRRRLLEDPAPSSPRLAPPLPPSPDWTRSSVLTSVRGRGSDAALPTGLSGVEGDFEALRFVSSRGFCRRPCPRWRGGLAGSSGAEGQPGCGLEFSSSSVQARASTSLAM